MAAEAVGGSAAHAVPGGPSLGGRVSQQAKASSLRVGDRVELNVVQCSLLGDGVGFSHGRALHIPGAFAGERAIVRVDHVDRQGPRIWAVLETLVDSHPARRLAPCESHRTRRGGRGCDGCAWMPLQPAAQRELHRDALAALGIVVDRVEAAGQATLQSSNDQSGWAPEVDEGSLGYRYSAKRVAFSGGDGRLRLGSYRRGSARPAPMHGCLVDHPRLRAAFDALEAACRAVGVAAREDGQGDLRAVWGATDGDAVHVTLVVADDHSLAVTTLPGLVDVVDGWSCAVSHDEGNDLRGADVQPLRGVQVLTMQLAIEGEAPLAVAIPPQGFLQPNPAIASRAWRDLCHLPDGVTRPAGTLALDLYAGSGSTTTLLQRQFAEVVPVESSAVNAAVLGVAPQGAADGVRAMVAAGRVPDLVVANPPRAGLGKAVCAALCDLAAPRLHIMSCNPASLQRDLELLAPAYQLWAARAYETLPQTPHVEVVAWLQRRES